MVSSLRWVGVLALVLAGCGDDEPATGGTGAGGTGAGGAGAGAGPSSGGNSTGGDGGGAQTTSSSSTGGVPEPGCATSGATICEDFEDAEDGMFPAGWGARGDEWGAGVIGVVSDVAYRGKKSLRVDGGATGQHFMDYKGALGSLASSHHGRVFMRVGVPAPWPTSGVLHADFIEGLGPGPNGGTHNVRWGVVENTQMRFQWIYNVQPSNAPEFAEGTSYVYEWTGRWQCIQWMYDEPSQTGALTIDGQLIPIVPGTSHAAEIPVFQSLGVGLANYQNAGEGFTVWFDELAYGSAPIACED